MKNPLKSKHRIKKFKKSRKHLKFAHRRALKFGTFFGTFEEFLIAVIAKNVFQKSKKKSKSKNGKHLF